MIIRIWRGWTEAGNAAAYEALLVSEVFPGIAAREITGYLGVELLRNHASDQVEFVTIMRFASLGAVEAFAGEDLERAYVPAPARKLLTRFDSRSAHYELRHSTVVPGGFP